MTVQLDVEAAAALYAGLGQVSGQLAAREQYLAGLCESVTAVETPGISFTGAQAPGGANGALAPYRWGPALGWSWAVQLITAGPLGTGDTLAVYRGQTTADNEPQRLKYQWAGSAGDWQAWAPGRTALILRGGKDGLVFDPGSGSLTSGTRYFVNVDVIQVADAALALFLAGAG